MHAAEVDFTNEALALSDAAASLSAARATVRLPAPHWRLSTPRVLIMEWMDGLPLSRVTGAELRERGIDPTVLMGRIADAWAIQMFVDGELTIHCHLNVPLTVISIVSQHKARFLFLFVPEKGIDPTVLMGRIADAWAIQMFVDGALAQHPTLTIPYIHGTIPTFTAPSPTFTVPSPTFTAPSPTFT
jgi:hypothetical protein